MMLRNPLNSAFQLIFANIIDYHIVPYHMVHMISCSVGCFLMQASTASITVSMLLAQVGLNN